MTEKQILEHPLHQHIQFLEDSHEYYFYPSGDFRKKKEKVKFNGVTSWISDFVAYKDWDKIALGSSKNRNSEWYGMEVCDIRKAWSDKGEESAEQGNVIHKAIEESINFGVYDDENSNYIDAFWETMDKYSIKPVTAEMVVYDKDIKRASPIDIFGMRNGKGIIVDTKTFQKGMEYVSYKDEKFMHPLSHLSTSKFNKTSLQTSIYKYWCEKFYGFEIDDTYCFLINDDGYSLIPLLDMTDEVKLMYKYINDDDRAPWE